MKYEINEHEARIKRTSKIFLKNNWIAHIRTFEGAFYNGRLFNTYDDYLEIHDRKEGIKKILYINIKKIVEYINEEGNDNDFF